MFYMIDKGDIRSIQCKMSLRGAKYMRNVDGLSLIFIDSYVPALSPRLNSTETSLQLSKGITLIAVCRIYTDVISKETYINTRCLGRSFIDCTIWGTGQNFVAPLLLYPLA
jgi:hypothetical protein